MIIITNVYHFEIGDSVVKKKKKSNSSETESNQSILPSVQLNVNSKIPNYKISSSNLALILNFKWSRNFDRLAKVLRLTLEIWREVNSCEFRVINLKVDFGISENLPQLSKRKEMNETIKTNFCLDKRIDTKNPPLWIDRYFFSSHKKFPNTRIPVYQKEKKRKEEKFQLSVVRNCTYPLSIFHHEGNEQPVSSFGPPHSIYRFKWKHPMNLERIYSTRVVDIIIGRSGSVPP